MNKVLSEAEVKELSAQLSCPEGEKGIAVAQHMNEGNISMIRSCMEAISLQEGQKLMELGPANAIHLSELMEKSDNLHYTGLEISEDMKMEAEKLNHHWIYNKQAEFFLYDGLNIPFQNQSFDHIFTVNTIYFWPEPLHFLKEIYRCLTPGGDFTLCFALKDFMESLPVTAYGFTLYDVEMIEELVQQTHFQIENFEAFTETVQSKFGPMVDRQYAVFRLRKP